MTASKITTKIASFLGYNVECDYYITYRRLRIIAASLTFFAFAAGGIWVSWKTENDLVFSLCVFAALLSLVSIVLHLSVLREIILAKQAIYKHRIKSLMGLKADLFPYIIEWKDSIYMKLNTTEKMVLSKNETSASWAGHCEACARLENYCNNLKKINPKW